MCKIVKTSLSSLQSVQMANGINGLVKSISLCFASCIKLQCISDLYQLVKEVLGFAAFASRPVSITPCLSEQLIACMAQWSPGWWISTLLGLSPRQKSAIAIFRGELHVEGSKAWRLLDGGLESSLRFARSSGSFVWVCLRRGHFKINFPRKAGGDLT